MSTYTASQLRFMARVVERAKQAGDPRYIRFIWAVARRVGLPPTSVTRFVRGMAT